jgi:hypothetical protein
MAGFGRGAIGGPLRRVVCPPLTAGEVVLLRAVSGPAMSTPTHVQWAPAAPVGGAAADAAAGGDAPSTPLPPLLLGAVDVRCPEVLHLDLDDTGAGTGSIETAPEPPARAVSAPDVLESAAGARSGAGAGRGASPVPQAYVLSEESGIAFVPLALPAALRVGPRGDGASAPGGGARRGPGHWGVRSTRDAAGIEVVLETEVEPDPALSFEHVIGQ